MVVHPESVAGPEIATVARARCSWGASVAVDPEELLRALEEAVRFKLTLELELQLQFQTKNLRAVQLLLGHSKLESALSFRCLGIEVDDALEIFEQTRSDGKGPLGRWRRLADRGGQRAGRQLSGKSGNWQLGHELLFVDVRNRRRKCNEVTAVCRGGSVRALHARLCRPVFLLRGGASNQSS
jgi:hypothetical protein